MSARSGLPCGSCGTASIAAHRSVPRSYELAVRLMLRQVDLLWERGILDYILLRGSKPAA